MLMEILGLHVSNMLFHFQDEIWPRYGLVKIYPCEPFIFNSKKTQAQFLPNFQISQKCGNIKNKHTHTETMLAETLTGLAELILLSVLMGLLRVRLHWD